MSKLLTVRLEDAEHAALKRLAGQGSMASLIKGWIGRPPVAASAGPADHQACDIELAGRDKRYDELKRSIDPQTNALLAVYTAARGQAGAMVAIPAHVIDQVRSVVETDVPF